jgi:hypothetical protein
MFKIVPVVQQGNNFDGMIYKDKEAIGGVGKDGKGLYVNLNRKLSLHETLELLKVMNGISSDFYQLEVDIQYVK